MNEKKCYEEELLKYIEGSLSEELNASVELHLETCQKCASDVESLKALHHLLEKGKDFVFSEVADVKSDIESEKVQIEKKHGTKGGLSKCPDPDRILKYHNSIGSIAIQARESLERHFSECEVCADALERLKRCSGAETAGNILAGDTVARLLELSIKKFPCKQIPEKAGFLKRIENRLSELKHLFNFDLVQNSAELARAYVDLGGEDARVEKIHLRFEQGNAEKSVYKFDRSNITLGRAGDNDVIINDPTVSGHHAEIRYEQNIYVLYDLNSTNGTVVNNKREHVFFLPPEGEILMGNTIIQFEVEFVK